jgi:hypothetical protein
MLLDNGLSAGSDLNGIFKKVIDALFEKLMISALRKLLLDGLSSLLSDVGNFFAGSAVVGPLEDVWNLFAELQVDYVGCSRGGGDLFI